MAMKNLLAASMLLPLSCAHMAASYETTLPTHISELLAVFLNPDLNHEWNHRLGEQRFVQTAAWGRLVRQTYALPWPLKTRELVMGCTPTFSRATHSVDMVCHSRHAEEVSARHMCT